MNYRISQTLTLFLILFLYSCSNTQTSAVPSLSADAKRDSVKNDEIKYPIAHDYLSLAQRAVIRPIYVETERDVKASHKGYLIHIKLKNSAQSTVYKDIKVEISYYNNDGAALDKEEIFLKKTITPGQSLQVSKKVSRYRNTHYKVKLMSAVAVEI